MKSLSRALSYLKPHWLLATGTFVSLVLAAALNLAIPALTQQVIDNGIARGAVSVILWGAGAMVAVALFRALFSFTQAYWAAKASQNVAYDLRGALYQKIQKLSFGYHDRAQTGQLLTRATSDVDRVQMFVGQGFIMFLTALLMIAGSLILLFSLDWQLALIMLVLMPLTMAIFVYFARRARPLFMRVQQFIARLNTVLQENLAGVRVVQAFAREPYEAGRFEAANTDLMEQSIAVGKMMSQAFPLIFLLANLGTLAVIWLGGLQVIGGRLTVGELVAFQSYLMMTMFPLFMLGMIVAMVSQAAASADRVFEILDAQSEVVEKPGAALLSPIEGRVAFEDVSFRYFGPKEAPAADGSDGQRRRRPRMGHGDGHGPSGYAMGGMGMGGPPASGRGDWVLDGVSFVAEPGQMIALLGATGSGKSTIINLIPRFYDVTRGRVTVDGVDVRDVTLDSLRSQIGMVLQETTLFTGTVRENIAYGRPEATMDEIVAAARAAEAHDFILEFGQGYDTPVGERGVTLSGGQKQRVAIARALLLDPRILILDDSTSSVDVETEYRIQKALDKLMLGRTTFVIAQRISTVRDADTILVLQDGRIAARGTHEELMRDSALYAEIYSSQLQSECELMPELCEEDLQALERSAALDTLDTLDTGRAGPVIQPEPAEEVR
ncbi:MAG: ABC transporter ATP-binding protein [Chloroflexi bacterium]|nr:MAG: ABC transporter ATP-binding protein [Chloroflexota bacterium]